MPTYGYCCQRCGKKFEIFQKITDSPITKCPDCGGKTSKIFYPVGIVFKGSGFHITDYCRPKEDATKPAPTTAEPAAKDKDLPKAKTMDKKAS